MRLPDDLSGPEGLEVLQILVPRGGIYYNQVEDRARVRTSALMGTCGPGGH